MSGEADVRTGPDASEGLGEVKAEALDELFQHSDVTNVRVTRCSAELLTDDPPKAGRLDFRIALAARHRELGFDARFTVTVTIFDEESETRVAIIEMTLIASFAIEGIDKPEKATINAFVDRVGVYTVMPFIREGLHTLSTRIGLAPITLGFAHQDKETGLPTTAWMAGTEA